MGICSILFNSIKMIKKKYKLTWKDINYLIRNKKVIYWKDFVFFVWNQYYNKKFNQISFQISVKLTKYANKRNYIKRFFFDYLDSKDIVNFKKNNKFIKIFVLINKKSIEKLKKHIETEDKNFINWYLKKLFDINFKILFDRLWRKL